MNRKRARKSGLQSSQPFPSPSTPLSRRQVLKRLSQLAIASLGSLYLSSCQKDESTIVEPEPPLDFPFDLSFNVHSDNTCNGLQLNSINQLRAQWLRISIPYSNLAAARPFTGRGFAILGIITDFGSETNLFRDLENNLEGTLRKYFDTYPSISHWQFLNEPTSFWGISPTDYVSKYLAPTWRFVRSNYAQLTLISAAPKGNSQGPILMAEMAAAGLEKYCNRAAVHIYNPVTIINYTNLLEKRIWITETGIDSQQQHVAWARDTLQVAREALNPERVFWYTLWDNTQYSLITINEDGEAIDGTSPLYDLLVNRGSIYFK